MRSGTVWVAGEPLCATAPISKMEKERDPGSCTTDLLGCFLQIALIQEVLWDLFRNLRTLNPACKFLFAISLSSSQGYECAGKRRIERAVYNENLERENAIQEWGQKGNVRGHGK